MSKEKVQEAIDYFLKTNDDSLLIEQIPFLEELWDKLSVEEGDFRSGVETYGYDNNDNRPCMEYISDRWMCAFRVKWILDGLENGSI